MTKDHGGGGRTPILSQTTVKPVVVLPWHDIVQTDVWIFDFFEISKTILEHLGDQNAVSQMDSKRYFSPSNALKTKNIHGSY